LGREGRAGCDGGRDPGILGEAEGGKPFVDLIGFVQYGASSPGAGELCGAEADELGPSRPTGVVASYELRAGAGCVTASGGGPVREQRGLRPGEVGLGEVLAQALSGELSHHVLQLAVGLGEEPGGQQRAGPVE
jgi:hypothetical protein